MNNAGCKRSVVACAQVAPQAIGKGKRRTDWSLAITFSLLAVLVACGGGDSASGYSAPPSTSTPVTTVTGPASGSGGGAGIRCYRDARYWPLAPVDVSRSGSRFVATGPLTVARAGHTATLMNNGKVLLTGGGQLDIDDLLVSIAAAEVFDPSSATFAPTGSLCAAREFHTATLLTNGKVLITGGRLFGGYPTWLVPTASAELYDPDSGTFSPTGSMTVGRTHHTASLLPDGRVLIVGGAPADAPAAELYEPASGTFSVAQGPGPARFSNTATVLVSGKVLITGGETSEESGSSDVMASAEIFDPGTNTFTGIASMNSPRSGHTSTLLADGKVLILGGASGAALAIGAVQLDTLPLTSAELFDPATSSFTPVAPMATGRIGHSAVLQPDGKVLVFGGFKTWIGGFPTSVGYQSYDNVELFDPSTGLFSSVDHMPVARFWHSTTMLPNGAILLAGGIGAGATLNTAELFR